MKPFSLLTLLVFGLLAGACSYRVEKEALPKVALDPQTVVFSEVSSLILGPKCSRCHGWTNSHADVSALLDDIRFRITSTDPATMMPPPGNPALSPEEKAALLGWIARGGPETVGEQPSQPPPAPTPAPLPRTMSFANVSQNVLVPKCAHCHRHADMAVTYSLVSANLTEIESRVRSDFEWEQMPPPGRAPALTDEEKNLLLDWIKAGAPETETETERTTS